MKPCIACSKMKPLAEYYAHPNTKDGHSGICKDCHCDRMFQRRRTNPSVQAYDRELAKAPQATAARRAVVVAWRQEHPEAYRAQTAVGNAIRDGKLVRLPCQSCGSTKSVHGHHDDYSRPLDVEWLCAMCHQRLHATGISGHRS